MTPHFEVSDQRARVVQLALTKPQGRETKHNWGPREQDIIRVRGMLKGEAHVKYHDAFIRGLRAGMLENSKAVSISRLVYDLGTRAGHCTAGVEKGNVAAFQAKLDAINKEHGDTYIDSIQPVFEPLMARHFYSSWNWVQDALLIWYDILHSRISTVNCDMTALCIVRIARSQHRQACLPWRSAVP